MNNRLEELLNGTNSNTHNYDVNLDNLYLYAAITEPKNINKESLINFFGDNLYKPNKEGDYLTHLLCRNAFIGSLSLEKTTKLFSFIYELISPNLPGKTTCSSIMEFMICSLDRLEIKVEDYLAYLLNLHYLNKYDFSYQDSYGYNLSVYFLLAFVLIKKDVMKLFRSSKVLYNFFDFLGCQDGKSKKIYDDTVSFSPYNKQAYGLNIGAIIDLYKKRKEKFDVDFDSNEKIKCNRELIQSNFTEYYQIFSELFESYCVVPKSYSNFLKDNEMILKLNKNKKGGKKS